MAATRDDDASEPFMVHTAVVKGMLNGRYGLRNGLWKVTTLVQRDHPTLLAGHVGVDREPGAIGTEQVDGVLDGQVGVVPGLAGHLQ